MESVIGNVGLLVSSKNSVVVNTPVIASAGLSVAKGVLERLKTPISEAAVEATMSISWRAGGKSRSRRIE